MKKCSKSLQK